MINNLNEKIGPRQEVLSKNLYKTLIAVNLGLLGFGGTFLTLRLDVNELSLDFVWSMMLPMLVTQAWGIKYGLVSLIIGLSAFHPFYLWRNTGWACFVSFFINLIWLILHGYGAEKRKQSTKYIYNVYFIQILCLLIDALLYIFLFPLLVKYNPPFWYNDAVTTINIRTLRIIFIKRTIQDFFILTVCDVLLLLPIVKRLFLFKMESKSRYNGAIFISGLAICIFFWFLSIFIEHVLPLRDTTLALSQIIDARDVVHLIILIMFCMFSGGVTIRYLEKKLKAEELIRKSVTDYVEAKRRQAEIQQEYKLLFDKMIDGMTINEFIYNEVDEPIDTIVVKANPAVEKQLGLKAVDIIGNNYIKFFEGNKENMKKLYNILKNDIPLKCETFSTKFNRYLLVKAFKVNSKQIGIMFHDVSELKQLEKKQKEMSAHLEAVFESTDDMIYSVDRNYRILNYNSSLKEYMKRSYGSEIKNGVSILEFVPEEIARIWKIYYDNAMGSSRHSFEYYIKHEKRYVEVFFNPIYQNEEVCGTAVFIKDITIRKEAQQQLMKINLDLEQLVEERTSELQNTLKELEAFTYTVSHDLKSPLRAIDGYSSIILEDYKEILEDDVVHMLTNISNISCDMINLIDRVLQYSMTSKASIQREKVNMEEMFVKVFEELKTTYGERNIEFSIITEIPIVLADKILIKQVVYNILSNAVKFTKNEERATINVGYVQKGNEQIFYVEDNGVGFDMKYSSKLFSVFQRLHNKEEYEGNGIGLATVYKVIQKHGGRVWIESGLNKGTRIYFTLPME